MAVVKFSDTLAGEGYPTQAETFDGLMDELVWFRIYQRELRNRTNILRQCDKENRPDWRLESNWMETKLAGMAELIKELEGKIKEYEEVNEGE